MRTGGSEMCREFKAQVNEKVLRCLITNTILVSDASPQDKPGDDGAMNYTYSTGQRFGQTS